MLGPLGWIGRAVWWLKGLCLETKFVPQEFGRALWGGGCLDKRAQHSSYHAS